MSPTHFTQPAGVLDYRAGFRVQRQMPLHTRVLLVGQQL
jgi:hypothetical protein